MNQENSSAPCVRVIVVANEKGGSGKSTVSIHIAVALMKAGHSVASIDLDGRQRSFTHYIDNRLTWARRRNMDLPTPNHVCFEEEVEFTTGEAEQAIRETFQRTIESLSENHRIIVIDTPCQHTMAARLAYAAADTLVTPLNDSFVDLDVLASVDPETFAVSGLSHYARVVEEVRRARADTGRPDLDWVVLRNRLGNTKSRNKRFVGDAIQQLAGQLKFRCVEGFAERVVFREFYPRGLTAVDELNETVLGSRPTMSNITAQLEVQSLVAALFGTSAIAEPIVTSHAA